MKDKDHVTRQERDRLHNALCSALGHLNRALGELTSIDADDWKADLRGARNLVNTVLQDLAASRIRTLLKERPCQYGQKRPSCEECERPDHG